MKLVLGIIGGTGLDNPDIFEIKDNLYVSTPFGDPSDHLLVGKLAGVDAVLLPRHDRKHSIMPTNINYRANMYALKKCGVTHIIAVTACGSMVSEFKPGMLCVIDQGINYTTKRNRTFYDGACEEFSKICHVPMAYAFNTNLQQLLIDCMSSLGLEFGTKGVIATIEGPCFNTRAESMKIKRDGASLVNMTTFPEVILAAELGIPYCSIGMATDYDSWNLDAPHVTVAGVLQILGQMTENVKKVICLAAQKMASDPNKWLKVYNHVTATAQDSIMVSK